MSNSEGSWATKVMMVCALTMTGVVVYDRFIDSDGLPETVAVLDWPELAASPLRSGADDAPVTMVVLADFECPGCRYFATQVMPGLVRDYGDRLAVVFRHWPLDYHRHAYPAARAAECAADQGHFWPYHDLLFQSQDSLGLKPFEEFAAEAEVPDLTAFSACIAHDGLVRNIDQDIEWASKIKAESTPTVVINGEMITRGAPEATVRRLIDKALPGNRR